MSLKNCSLHLVALSVAALSTARCAPSATDDASATESELAVSPGDGFHPMHVCTDLNAKRYIGELDVRDHAHPRYRIRHKYPAAEIGKQNINLYFRDGASWKSPDALISKYGGPTFEVETPWSDLPVSADVLAHAFSVKDGKYNLDSFEITFNFPGEYDKLFACRKSFY